VSGIRIRVDTVATTTSFGDQALVGTETAVGGTCLEIHTSTGTTSLTDKTVGKTSCTLTNATDAALSRPTLSSTCPTIENVSLQIFADAIATTRTRWIGSTIHRIVACGSTLCRVKANIDTRTRATNLLHSTDVIASTAISGIAIAREINTCSVTARSGSLTSAATITTVIVVGQEIAAYPRTAQLSYGALMSTGTTMILVPIQIDTLIHRANRQGTLAHALVATSVGRAYQSCSTAIIAIQFDIDASVHK